LVSGGRETTFAILASTKNEAAVNVLTAALDSADRDVHMRAINALIKRRSSAGHRELLRRWPQLSDRWKSQIAERPGRISGAVRDALVGNDRQLRIHACDAVLWIREFDLIPALLTVAEDDGNPQAELAAQTLLSLCEMLYEDLAAPRDYQQRCDPHSRRRYTVAALEKSVQKFEQHQRGEVVEAFLLLAGRENTLLRRILHNPHHKAYLPTVHSLTHSPRPGVMRLLIRFLDDTHAPTTIYSVLSRRRDVSFLRLLLKRIEEDLDGTAKGNLKRVEAFSWLERDLSVLAAFNDREQEAAVRLAVMSGMKRLEVFEIVRYMLQNGGVGARRSASASLAEFKGAEANRIVLKALHDDDAEVRAAAVAQLRDRGIPNALSTLIGLLDCPEDAVRRAAQMSLSEFRFDRYVEKFEFLDDNARSETGQLVKRVDPTALERLADEMRSSSRARRLRAVEMAVAMKAVIDLEEDLVRLLGDDDQFLRAEVIRAIRGYDSPTMRAGLRERLLDASVVVKEAAEEALQLLAQAACGSSVSPDLSSANDEPGTISSNPANWTGNG
jgi:HEAT repeat protein